MTIESANISQTIKLEVDANELVVSAQGSRKKLERMFQITRYYRWSQIAIRFRKIVLGKLSAQKFIGEIPVGGETALNKVANVATIADVIVRYHRDHISHRQNNVGTGELVLLNQKHKIGWPYDWTGAGASHLWRFQLHYHEFLLQLVAEDEARTNPRHENWGTIWAVIRDWIEKHQPETVLKQTDAWHPYCIARRLAAWAWLLSLSPPDDELQHVVLKSIAQQAQFLKRNLETDVRANHLFENYAALAISGFLIQSQYSESWLDCAESGIRYELPRQILEHGEHFELAPMYHYQILSNVLRVGYLAINRRPNFSKFCFEYAVGMMQFLTDVTHPDGEIPLFSDSCFHESPSVPQLKKVANLCGLTWNSPSVGAAECGPYWMHRESDSSESDFIVFDRGAVAADELPAHAHCDLLNFEASIDGQRWFVDSGNYYYEAGSMRQYCRSSLAHNVVTVEGENQCDIYSKFRMGRRGRITSLTSGQSQEFCWARASHDGYRHLGVNKIERMIAVKPAHALICTDVAFSNKQPSLFGYLHLSPDVSVKQVQSNRNGDLQFEIKNELTRRFIRFFGCQNVSIEQGWYCSAFGVREKNSIFIYEPSSIDIPSGWMLSLPDSAVEVVSSIYKLAISGSNFNNTIWKFD
ncbi:MAG: alginate lyase family protein [Mariniblastus sp.]|nr:alginate lyase family protein [Mariniblastus sp.]